MFITSQKILWKMFGTGAGWIVYLHIKKQLIMETNYRSSFFAFKVEDKVYKGCIAAWDEASIWSNVCNKSLVEFKLENQVKSLGDLKREGQFFVFPRQKNGFLKEPLAATCHSLPSSNAYPIKYSL